MVSIMAHDKTWVVGLLLCLAIAREISAEIGKFRVINNELQYVHCTVSSVDVFVSKGFDKLLYEKANYSTKLLT